MRKDSISSLIERCIDRDEAAWSSFVNHFTGLVKWAISDRLRRWRITFNNEDVDDIKQLTFSELWEKDKLREIRDIKKIEAWLAVVAGNCAISCMRGRRGQNIPYLKDTLDHDTKTEDAYSVLEGNEIRELVISFIDKLPKHHQAVLVLNYFYGKRHKEIAEIVKISIHTISTIIKRTRRLLKEELKSKGYENF